MKAIKDLKKLKPIAKEFKLKFDSEYKYILNDVDLKSERALRERGFALKYVSGCFYPFLFEQ